MIDEAGSFINPSGFIFTIVMGISMLFLPRRFVFVPIIATACFITLGQRLVIAGLDFTMIRILVLFGWTRVIIRKEIFSIKFNKIDRAIIWFVIINIFFNTLLWRTSDAFINRLGFAFNAIGIYFLFRFLIRDINDISRLFKILSLVAVILAIIMLIEKSTGHNLFAVFGGVPEITAIRDGKLRCQGPFAHPILAGTFGATLMPLLFSLWWQKNGKILAFLGVIACSIITITSHSSGPVMAYIFGIIGLSMWPFRNNMRTIKWGIFFTIIILHFIIMKAPVWFLIGKLGHIIGGTGWHRSELIDSTIRHFNEWWLFGTKYTRHWLPTGVSWSPDHTDITNMFIRQGVDGGLVTMILFIIIIVRCFQGLGRAIQNVEYSSLTVKIILWSMGVALFAHVVSFFSVSYFDQMILFWYLLLAMISSIELVKLNNADSTKTSIYSNSKICA